MKLIFATNNKGKLREVTQILKPLGCEVIGLSEAVGELEIPETGNTLEANASIKASTVYNITGLPVIADDSGLEVEALSGAPGVFSARYAGENCSYDDNNRKIISELSDFPIPYKSQFKCCAIFFDGAKIIQALGTLKGELILEQRGKNGFGYDPLFIPDGYEKTLAEMSAEQKNSISHRARAFNSLFEQMKSEGVLK
ncbi:MAG: RdgB/HAM1 family non-canonical purine NTP pyrophosphatase [Ignavibacteriales bacterium]|nr:RdgB/HAM1 family non-canonical purine NTP pyrophosphatase [Ignavibacteriales bacterium]MCF8304937.1 RdgB/HAM1 family non-canonical purine NTP pyrophosphatase [Ignavibacteriales bacterium]MCF8314626.1 RdgB/HAM1 family non-canonical purine NTP pyrophosphatase [Ignavibacteriales bacterium]MCF8436337.1 RdgB/HAM1 family non-canonical purine NTP pyrophosphatase [Ignavibacteriales bacterium]